MVAKSKPPEDKTNEPAVDADRPLWRTLTRIEHHVAIDWPAIVGAVAVAIIIALAVTH